MLVCTGLNSLHAFFEVVLSATDDDGSVATMVSELCTVENAINKLCNVDSTCEPGLNDLVTACDDICREESFHHKLQVVIF